MSRAGARHRARELVLQGLYQHRLGGNEPAAIRGHFAESPRFAEADEAYLDTLWRGVHGERAGLLEALGPHLDRPASEVSPIESAILLIAAWELLHALETPYRVVLNEAVELAKAYGGIDGHRFVNAVLDKLAAQARAPEIAASARGRQPR